MGRKHFPLEALSKKFWVLFIEVIIHQYPYFPVSYACKSPGTSWNEKWSFVLIGVRMQLIKQTIKGQVRKIIKPQGFVPSMKACDDTMQALTHEYQTNHWQGLSKSLAQAPTFILFLSE